MIFDGFYKYQKIVSNFLEKETVLTHDPFHYTVWDGLEGILKSQQLWLSQSQCLEDRSEVQYAFEEIKNYILKNTKGDLHSFFSELFLNFKKFADQHIKFYMASFCENRDYLPAWRNYANDGDGFSLGFKKEFFCGKPILDSSNITFGRGRVHYGIRNLTPLLDKLISITSRDLRRNHAFEDLDTKKKDRDFISKFFLAAIFPLLSLIKNEYHDTEIEFRIYSFQWLNDQDQIIYSRIINVAEANQPVFPKRPFSFELHNISEILIGPKSNFFISKMRLEELLSSLIRLGHDVSHIKISRSKIPYKSYGLETTSI